MEKILSWLNDFKSFFTSEVSKISNAQAELAKVTQSLSEANTALSAAQGTIADLNAKLATANESATKNTEEIAALKLKLTEAENKATEALASQGLNPNQLPKPQDPALSQASEEKKRISGLKGLAKAIEAEKFEAKNRLIAPANRN